MTTLAPAAVAAAPAAQAAPAAPQEEKKEAPKEAAKTTFAVKLLKFGDGEKVKILKQVRQLNPSVALDVVSFFCRIECISRSKKWLTISQAH